MNFGQISDNGKQSVDRALSNLGLILEHITILNEVRMLSIHALGVWRQIYDVSAIEDL